ncbi:MAG: acyl-CoA reductase [Phaeodactylibacter sp.]|nr:acyl-CoA reductase [Phaeodactylibacter sp.]MCB9050285.1 acyl-CoA reductase [Lewinellaceae bacterium]
MTLPERINVLIRLGEHLRGEDEYLDALMHRTSFNNSWFTIENQKEAVSAIAQNMLRTEKLEAWLQRYAMPAETVPQTVGIVMAGNIPLVGFHDLLCVFVAGHRALVKLSDKDQYLLPYLLRVMGRFDERAEAYFNITQQLKGFDAVIATGSNNSARYFEAYFKDYPHIIRRNRNGIAVLTGEETEAELLELGKDIFQYFGLGCRNVSKIYVPRGYDFDPLLEALHEYRQAVLHTKYKNNFDYNYAIHILNKEEFKANGCILLREDSSLQSRIASLHYEYYDKLEAVEREIERRKEEIQCTIAREGLLKHPAFSFGKAQHPELWDYADGVDTMDFLLGI